jgi:hypothetical protein
MVDMVRTMTGDELSFGPDLRPPVLSVRRQPGYEVPGPGTECVNDRGAFHTGQAPADDAELEAVSTWLAAQADVPPLIGDAQGRSEREGRHKSWLMRPHRVWLRAGANNGRQARDFLPGARPLQASKLYDWRTLHPNPLKLLSDAQRTVILGPAWQERRLITLFEAPPEVVIPRAVILTVCAQIGMIPCAV